MGLFKNIGKALKKGVSGIGKGVKNASKWVAKKAPAIVKGVGTVAQVVGTVAQVVPVIGNVAGGALLVGGTMAKKAADKFAPLLDKVKKVEAVVGKSRINKMVEAVDKKGFVNTNSIKNTLIAKGIQPLSPIVSDMESILKTVVEVKKDAEAVYNTGVETKMRIPVMSMTTKSSPVSALVSSEKAMENNARATAVYNQGNIMQRIKNFFSNTYEKIKQKDPKTLSWVIGLPVLLIGGIIYLRKGKKGGKHYRS